MLRKADEEARAKTNKPFVMRELVSDLDPVTQYLKLQPKFQAVFNKYDVDNKGWLDERTFAPLIKALDGGQLAKDAAEYEAKIQDTKDCFHASMRASLLTYENFKKDQNGRISWDLFWEFLSSQKQQDKIKKQGLRTIFLAFGAWGVLSYQQEFLNLKPRFIEAFNKYDLNSNGYIDKEEFKPMMADLLTVRPELKSQLHKVDENQDGKITWGEFWKFFSTGDRFATDQSELDKVHKSLEAWGV
mmetsp:Transcript_42870/g.84042  ORF Transcript_42870/g.84042 Transcript_42870/m.84042 type:complete len:244 (+) Transcript_42870:35-766(+)